MTCILGIEHNNKVVMASDSGAWCGDGENVFPICEGTHKLVKLKTCLVGIAGVFGLGQRFFQELHAHARITPATIREAMRCAQELHNDDDDTIQALVGVKGVLYVATSDGSVVRSRRGFAGTGAYQYAMGFLDASKWTSTQGLRDVLRGALRCQARYSSSCYPPFVIRST